MKKQLSNSARALALSVSSIALVIAGPVNAQDAQQDEEQEEVVDVTQDEQETTQSTPGAITVTGSRIKRDTFSSISPLQVLTTEEQNESGLFDPSQILQRNEAAAGTQIDATFQGFVLDNGPGSQTINLRGLGADRTLLLINGRRMAPAGVEGAPTNPSINLLPGTLVERYDLLLDGASSVYGSDAVAGVVNIVLKKDFDGLELTAIGNANPMGGGDDYTLGASWGFNGDRGFFGVGVEYSLREEIRLKDRDFFDGCDTHYEIDQNGNIRTLGLADNAAVQNRNPLISVAESECKVSGISGRIYQPYARFGSVYFPGNGNIANFPVDPRTGRPFNFGDSSNAFGQDLDRNGDGIRDVDFQNVNTNGANRNQVFVPQQKLLNVMAYGEFTMPNSINLTPYFEAGYSRAEIYGEETFIAQLFPYVPDLNEFNPCNFITNPNGVDCRAVDNALQALAGRPFPPLSSGFPLPTNPIVAIRGDRNDIDVVQEQFRAVVGLRGDLPFFGPNWSFDTSAVYSRAKGVSRRSGIREDRLALALGLDPTADYDGDGVVDNDGDGIADDYNSGLDVFGFFGDPLWIGTCNTAGLANPGLAAPDLNAASCVPVNLFAPSVLSGAVGDFETQAERDYLFGKRVFNTVYKQLTWNAFVAGDLMRLPGGSAGIVLGAEYRRDEINSQPDIVASNGLFWGFFSDLGAKGSKETKEVFGELDLPLLAGLPLIEELDVKLAGRITDDEYYGTNRTWSGAVGWRPISSLLLRATYGTSFRAPNLRENFLAGQSGFSTLFDPCAVPTDAFVGGAYSAADDNRDPTVLANCSREGRDPTRVGIDAEGLNTNQFSSVEVTSGGSLDIDPERSTALTAGFSFDETFGEIDISLGMSYFRINLKDSIVEPSSQFIVNDCYTRDDGQRSPFCDRISVDTSPSSRKLISDVNSGFINLNKEKVEGIDFNAFLGTDANIFGENVRLGVRVRANHLLERSSTYIDDTGEAIYDDDAGEFGLPKWTGSTAFTADIDKFRLTYAIDYTGPVEQDSVGIDPLSSAFGIGPDGAPAGVVGDTCLGDGTARVPGDGIFCRDVGFAKAQFLHTVSLRYRTDTWSLLVGVSNLFNTAPPLVDGSEVFAINNVAIGNGYNYDGREFFMSVTKSF